MSEAAEVVVTVRPDGSAVVEGTGEGGCAAAAEYRRALGAPPEGDPPKGD